ncbi:MULTISPECIES: trypsin-like peptidase domain-containing protein [Myxococcus]|uniref:PDZ domain-containing protein n=1 Tax=Myxococcus llanfairpwllgwyngyllgogerychwyrndrobwllllantysiliogogogochensis TaxID=2590453 RepID=A0A540WXE9_9BACT|nr:MULTISPECIES: trypsin-like peptidase domain-containing protein [Myxococcus]NTX03091.1 trypsin-like peptidase domain-containing protein [Myxococcus sp. CA040A]TQF13687.1 PDZ domain-containing protein [Myxococcus llanfairpwllgwyngyllgogerychwyrndrobwllllantysiliogogogochensis]
MKGSRRVVAVGLVLTLAGCRREQEEAPPAPPPSAQQEPAAPSPEAAPEGTAPAKQPMPPDMRGALASIAPLVESVKSAVVNVEVREASPARGPRRGSPWNGGGPGSPFGGGMPFGSPFEDPREEGPRQGLGSGFVIDARGLVLTNNHVVADATEIRVQFPDGRELDAKVLGTDPLTDVAVLQLKGEVKGLPVVKLGDSDALRVGDWVVAIGNPFGLASSVSLGIVSAKARDIQVGPFDDFLQTDAAINPGNSGGPLFNLHGEVVGINTAIVGQGSGIGFAVPSTLVKELLPQLEKDGAVTRGWLGVAVQDLTADLGSALGVSKGEGAIVTEVNEGTPAAEAGLKPDDIIVAAGGRPVTSGRALTRTVALKAPGSELPLTVYRGGKKTELKAKLGTRPDLEGVASRKPPEEHAEPPHQRVGLSLSDMDPRLSRAQELPRAGALVTDVVPGSSAERSGLLPGMVVVEARGQPVRRATDLARVLKEAEPGESVLLRVAVPGGRRELRALTAPES